MRYWIYWNELIQGPFELEELISLRAFSDNLLVCLEDRQDWLPAARVADLAPSLEILRSRHAEPRPPPPPPSGPPAAPPLQGEFFGEPPGQQHLFEPEDGRKGPLAYAPVLSDIPNQNYCPTATVTMPIHFTIQTHPIDPGVSGSQGPVPRKNDIPGPQDIEWSTEIPEATREKHEPIPFPQAPLVDFPPPPVIRESPAPAEIPDSQPAIQPSRVDSFYRKNPVVLGELTEQISDTTRVDTLADIRREVRWGLLPWILAVAFCVGLVGSIGYWMMDHFTSRSAIAEATRPEYRATGQVAMTSPREGAVRGLESSASTRQGTAQLARSREQYGQPLHAESGRSGLRPTAETSLTPQGGAMSGNDGAGATSHAPSMASRLANALSRALHAISAAIPVKITGGAKVGGVMGNGQPSETSAIGATPSPEYRATRQAAMTLPREGAVRGLGSPGSTRQGTAQLARSREQYGQPLHAESGRSGLRPTAETSLTPQGGAMSGNDGAGATSHAPSMASRLANALSRALHAISAAIPVKITGGAKVGGVMGNGQPSETSAIGATPSPEYRATRQAAMTLPREGAVRGLGSPGSTRQGTAQLARSREQYGQPLHAESGRGGLRPTGAANLMPQTRAAGTRHAKQSLKSRSIQSLRQTAAEPTVVGKAAAMLLRFLGDARPAPAAIIPPVDVPAVPDLRMPAFAGTGRPAARANAKSAGRPAKTRQRDRKNVRQQKAAAQAGSAAEASAETKSSAAPMTTQTIKVPNAMVPGLNAAPTSTLTSIPMTPDPWGGRFAEAIGVVQGRTIFAGKRTIGNHAKQMLAEMHERELLHAADTGERLYLPDKLAWSALRQEGSQYRVYLNFSALQATGDRAQTLSYQFVTDLQTHDVSSDNVETLKAFLENTVFTVHQHNPMVDDIEGVLSAVDALNKQKMRAMIIVKGHRSKEEQASIHQAFAKARAKLEREIVYFRTKYAEKILRNIAKAYEFSELLKTNDAKTTNLRSNG